ncbi:muscle-specific protein 300 kDa [Anabrus simplex]|uniref:muscle-specific protein 300 kDa n=1 Tax=Anabrus simplex TaxID=316456 RepID=UPI0035A34B84
METPPPDESGTGSRKLKDRVSFYEQVWSGGEGRRRGDEAGPGLVDVAEIERRLQEEQRKRRAESPAKLEQVKLRSTPVTSPRSVASGSGSESFEETVERMEEEGDLYGSGAKVVKFERITVHRSVREYAAPGPASEGSASRTPSEERLLQDDSAYHTVSQPSANGVSKSSSITSLAGRFPSEESLRRTPSREQLSGTGSGEWETGPKHGSLEWYSEYRTQSFQNMAARLEYVRSRSEYDTHIAEIKDEQERVQKKTFVNWINSYLSKRVPPLRIDDLIEDLKDGTKLLALLEVLSGEKLPVERGRNLKRPHFLSNANTALQFLQSKKIKLVNINSSDLVDGRPPVVLGLIWTIILYFQIEENTRALESLGHTFGGSASSLESMGARSADEKRKATDDKRKTGAKRALLQWVTNTLPPDLGVEVKDFGSSWRDGIAFLGIIDAIKANLINLAALRQANNRTRLETAFHVAESELGIARLLDPEDVDVARPDEKSIMTYVAQFLHKYPEPRTADGSSTLAAIEAEYNEFISWLLQKTQYLEHLQQTNSLPNNYSEYMTFKNEVDSKVQVYEKLRRLVESQNMISITLESWREIDGLWTKLEAQLRHWLWLLDSRLPGALGEVGEWLGRAEALIVSDDIPTAMNEETASIISRKLEEHKVFFADLPAIKAKFDQARSSSLAQNVPPEQLHNMAQRLETIGPRAAQRRIRLKFLEHKCCLIAFLHLTETKLRGWTVKYGREEKVQQLLEQYRNFVSRNRIFQEFNKAYIDMQQVVDEYKREGNIDQREGLSIDRFMRETGERWKNVSMELRCVQSMLEEVVAYWRRWNTLADEFEAWLDKAYGMLDLPEEDKMEYFQDVSVWKDKHQLLGDTVSFLIATCEDQVAHELKERYLRVSTRWEDLFQHVKQYMHAGDILRNRKDYRAGVERLQQWLRNAESVLSSTQLSNTERIKAYGQQLQQLQSEVEGIEDLFKNVSKIFQSMIQDLSREEVDRMMNTLKKEKEALVRVRALIPMQLHLFHQILVQQESLEAGQAEISQWLDEADSLLASHSLAGGKEPVQAQLDKHKAFFSRTLYYKSMLESKNKVFQSIVKSVDHAEGIDTSDCSRKMAVLNDRFTRTTQLAQQWEQKLQEAVRCWHNFRESERIISEWLQNAEKLIAEKHIDTKQTVEFHKNFFERVNERWIQDLVNAAQDLRNCLPVDQQAPIAATVDRLQAKWKDILSFAPLHLMRLEFRLDEATFTQYLKEIEKEISSEQQAFNKHEDVGTILTRHKAFFEDRVVVPELQHCLSNMAKLSSQYTQWKPGDNTLSDAYDRAETQWKGTAQRIELIRQQLQQIPAQWKTYHQKYAEMVQWMDSVDTSLNNIIKEVNSLEEFEKERAVFQGICREVDTRREDMKWLVQTLDSLVSHCSDEESLAEQRRLEQLIIRYKNLIPTIELTMVKTDVHYKCYTYRKEVREVCGLLQKVKETSMTGPHPETLDSVVQLIRQQESAVTQLDQQRPNIMSMLQRGKDLARDTHAPAFIKPEVTNLESSWNEAYNQTVEKLKKLKGTQKVWFSYKEQKDEILRLLEQAEEELRKATPATPDNRHLAADLQAKQDLSVSLREATEDMLRRLRDLCQSLCNLTAPERKPLLQKEVTEIERRLHVTLETVQDRVVYLQQFKAQWTRFQARLGELKEWTQQGAPALMEQLQAQELTPEERLKRAQVLQAQISDKVAVLDVLSAEAAELLQADAENVEATQLRSEVLALRDAVGMLQHAVGVQMGSVERDLVSWQEYRHGLQEVRPWVEQAEVKVSMGMPKPITFMEAQNLQQQAKLFKQECEAKLGQLQGVAAMSQQIMCRTNAPDEVDAVHSRWASVHDVALQWGTKMDKLVATWQQFETEASHVEQWINQGEGDVVDAPLNLNTPEVEKLERELAELKAFNKEVSEKQAQLITLTQLSDNISQGLALEGATAIKGRVAEMKGRVTQLAEGVRHKINLLSDAILARQEFQGKMSNFVNWMDQLESSVDQVDEVSPDKVDSALQTVHALLQEHSEKQPQFNIIYGEVKKLTSFSTPEETTALNQNYSELSEKYQDLEDNLQEKKSVLEKWSELLSWHADASDHLSHIQYQLDSQKPGLEDLANFAQELELASTKTAAWSNTAPGIDVATQQSKTLLREKGTGKPVTAVALVNDIQNRSMALRARLVDMQEVMEQVGVRWTHFQALQQGLSDGLLSAQGAIQEVALSVNSCEKLEPAVKTISALLEEHRLRQGVKTELHSQGKVLMEQDQANVGTIQNILASIDANWEKVNEMLKEQKARFVEMNIAWKHFQDAKEKVCHSVSEAQDLCKSVKEVANDVTQAVLTHDKSKKALEILKKSKVSLDTMDNKGQILMKQAEQIPDFNVSVIEQDLLDTHKLWQDAYDTVTKNLQNLEAQLIIWKQIDDAKGEVLHWLSESSEALENAVENLADADTGQTRLNRYKDELPTFYNLKASIIAKTAQLVKLNDGKQIPTLDSLNKLMEEQFAHVKEIADKLEDIVYTFGEQEKQVRADMKKASDTITRIREAIIKCDDLSGENSKILERLQKCQALKQELTAFGTDLQAVSTKIEQMKKNYPAFGESGVAKELGGLEKRYDGVLSHAHKIESTLLTFLKKYHAEKFGALQRVVATHKEKVAWCLPEAGSDLYNLEVKMSSLQDVLTGLTDCDEKQAELDQSLQLLQNVESPEKMEELMSDRNQLIAELEALKNNYKSTKQSLEHNVNLWQKYELMSENVASWLREMEAKVRAESVSQVNLGTITDKINEMETFRKEVAGYEPEVEAISSLGEEIMQENPESRVGQYVGHLTARYQAVLKFANGYVDRLHGLNSNKDLYRTSVKEVEAWLGDADAKLKSFEQLLAAPAKPMQAYQAKLEELKAFMEEREKGQALLNKAVETGEALFSGVTPENRETIRGELRSLRDGAEALIDKANVIHKKVEGIMMQRSSFDDSYSQVRKWVTEAEAKLGSRLEPKATLKEKKMALHGYRTIAQDVNTHRNIMKQLQDKIGTLSDSEATAKFNAVLGSYEKLSKDVDQRIVVAEKHVSDHEAYLQALEKSRDWLSTLNAEAAIVVDDTSMEKEGADVKLAVIEGLLQQKDEGDKLLQNCHTLLQVVLEGTDISGHPGLLKEFEEQKKAWEAFLSKCTEAQARLRQLCSRWTQFEEIVDALTNWIKTKEAQVKDQSLRSTQEAKQVHLDKLRAVEEEIAAKSDEFTSAIDQSQSVEVESELAVKVSRLTTRYQALKNTTKEAVTRYEQFVKEHRNFNEEHAAFLQWLSQVEEQLKELSQIVGDLAVLQDRQKKIRELADVRSRESAKFDALVESGEKLYAHTSPDGREIIRQQLRTLRTLWDNFSDDLQAAMHKLDQCLMQFAEFNLSQEQLTKWLKDVERAMTQHTELKASLQEKRAQLQNHKIMHQEIMSHQQLVESVCDKAQQLVDQTQDKSLNIYLQSIKQLFHNIVVKSQDLLDNLEECAQKHSHFSTLCKSFRDWLSAERDNLNDCDDVSGEKADINKRLATVKLLRDNRAHGDKQLAQLKELLGIVSKGTAPKGIDILEKEVEELEASLQQHLTEVDGVETKLQGALKQWLEFEEQLDQHTKWFRTTEAIFRDQQLQTTLKQKEAQLENYRDKRNLITDREKDIDEFVDRSHALLHCSGVERIKPLISQISNRYQLLHVLSKEVINRWQGLVDDHRVYDDKLQETVSWLGPLEEHLAALRAEDSANNMENKMSRLQLLLSEREQASHKLGNLTALGERLFPDTAAPGREKIRQDLRALRDRWDRLEEGIKEQQKLQECQTMQWSSYQETLQQTLAWLEAMEKTLLQDPASSWASSQEIRSKLLKHKTTLQEVITHKRVIEAVTEKAQAVVQLSNMKGAGEQEVLDTVKSINHRYEQLVNNLLVTITQLEESLDAFQQFHDLQKSHQDYMKQLWDRLAAYSDYSGNKPALQSRLAKVQEIQENLNAEGLVKLKALTDHVNNKTGKLPPRAKEAMERDLANLKFDFEKFVAALNDVLHSLEERLQQWSEYEGSFDRLLQWLSESEAALKNYAPRSTLEEKQEQLEKYQSLILSLRQNEAEFDKMADESSDLVQISGDTRISVNVQQITSRFQSIQTTAKEIVKKCEQAVADHEAYTEKYRQCTEWLAAAQARFESCRDGSGVGARQDLVQRSTGLKELLSEQPSATSLLNNTIELGEKLYPSTALEGRENIRQQLQDLQQAMETLYDGVSSTERELQAKLSRWMGFEECSENLRRWLTETEAHLPKELELKTTLDEKRAQLQTYRALLHDAVAHQQDIVSLRDKTESLPKRSDSIDQQLASLTQRHADILKRAQSFVERYEAIVSDHQQYSKAVMDTQEWLDATHNTVLLWGDTELERISLHTNLERLKNLQMSLPEEQPRIELIRSLGEKVIPGTIESGQVNIRSQIDSSQQEWEGLVSAVKSTIEALDAKLQQWNEYETLKDQCLSWIRETDTKLHAVDLKDTAEEKKEQLEFLKNLQGEVRAKELEMDAVTERAQQLYKGSVSTRSSLISELGFKYQQVSHKVKDLTARWHQYVTSHQEFDSHIAECTQWLEDIKNKLSYCSDLSASSQKDLEGKLETIQDLLLYKEEGFTKVQGLVELAQTVLANTAPSGHAAINQVLAKLQEEWSALASRMLEIKTILDDSIHRWSGFLEQIHQLGKTVEFLESVSDEVSEFQTTMSEKRAQLERIKNLEEKVRCEKIEVDSLKAKAAEMLASGQQSHAATQAQGILNKFDKLAEKIKNLLGEREDQCKDHRLYKEAYDDLIGWLSRAREKIPSMKQRSLSDKLAIENVVAPLEALLNKQAQGELLVEHLQHTGEVVIASTSPQGQEIIRNEIRALRENFEGLFKEIKQQKEQLEATVIQWRDYKEEYERLSDWLQQIDILVKAQKTALLGTVQEKTKQVQEMKDIMDRLEKGQEQIDKFNKSAAVLLTSHLDTYINNQLRHLNSRYQVQVNLAKDVLKKVETNLEQHQQYVENLEKAKAWIENAKQVVWDCGASSASSNREELQARLDQVQELLRKREEGQNLVHATVNCGEKVLRNTRSDGRDTINSQLKDLQAEWDRLVRKISTAKVHLETSLLQWADYSSSYSQLQQWITDREAKLQQVCEHKVTKPKKGPAAGLSALGIGERKATLRQTSSIVQDIVSFEPMIQSVTSKAEDLLQAAPASEISSKYETLSKQAKELYAKQKETVEQHQAFIDAGNDFMQWIRAAKEKLSKCSEPTGDKESLSSKVSQLKVLQSEQEEGQQKLEKALEQGDVACQVADQEDKEVIEEEVALLQEEFDNYVESLNQTKTLLEVGIVRWTEYEDQYQEASDWLTQTEQLVQTFNKLQDSLEEKKNVLELFQVHLQTLFDWQKELDRLNMKAQVLLETCADTRISNAVTQMTTKYNALLSLAKEIMRRLELHYQEHQQHNTLYQECQDWVDRTRDKLNECQEVPSTLTEVNNKLQTVKGIRQSLEQGQNKLRYVLELKEKVILNTEQNGAAKIQEDTENLKQEFEKLMVDVQDLRQKLTARASQLEDIQKAHKLLADWLAEVELKVQPDEMSEKRATLEKFRSVQRDINGHAEIVERLKARLAEDPTIPPKDYETSISKYQQLKELVAANIAALEEQVKKQELYKQAYNDAFDWLRKTRIDIQQCSDPHGEKEQTIDKEKKMVEIAATFPRGEELLERAHELGNAVTGTVGSEAQDALRQEYQQLRADWEGLQVMSKDTQKVLAKCISAWNDFSATFDRMKGWLDAFKVKVEAESEGDQKTPEELHKCRALLQEAVQQKVVMEELNDRCEALMELSACSWVRDQTVQLQGAYTNLLTIVQGLVSRVEKNLSDHTEFLKAKQELDTWLKTAHGTIHDCIGVGDEASTRDKLETIQMVSTRMTEGQHLLSIMQDVFTKAINTAPPEQQDTLRDDMASLRNSWDQLNMDLTSVMAQQKAALSRWEDYNEQKARLEVWITNMEKSLQEVPDTKAELGEMKTLIERYKHLQAEVNDKRADLDHLVTEAAELSKWASRPAEMEEMQKLQARWDQLVAGCVSRREALELEMGEYTAYHQSLQNTEKWILQTSFTLMAHNSLYITNKQQTLEQIQQHEALLEDIQKYQGVLDDVRAKGRGQINRYMNTTPAIKETIEKQLNNVQDSYNSLLHTAVQIKKRLMESLAKFEEYEETLESIRQNLDIYEPIIMQELEAPVTSLKLAHQQLEETRGLHNKLQAEKSRLAVAVQACEAAAACISRPSSPQDTMPPPIPDRELMVRARLEDLIDQTSSRDDKPRHENKEETLKLLLENLRSDGSLVKLDDMHDKVQSRMSTLSTLVGELEEAQRQRAALQMWAGEQQATVTEWRNRPAKLRPEAARAEQLAMQELQASITERRAKLKGELSGGEEEDPNLEAQLNKLEADLADVRAKKEGGQRTIEGYRQKLHDIHGFFDSLSKRMEELDKGSGLECPQKIAIIADIESDFNSQAPPKVDEVKQLGNVVMDLVSNLDAQQVEEQLKSVDRRYNDLAKRIQRKNQVLNMAYKGLEGARQEIDGALEWVREKIAQVQAPPPLGFESKAADDRHQALKALLKEVEGKRVLVETLEKRVGNMQAELEPAEQQMLENKLQALSGEHDRLLAILHGEMDRVSAAADARRKLETDLEAAHAWLKAKSGEAKKLSGYLPLRSSAVEAEIQRYKAFENDLRNFSQTTLSDVTKQVNALQKDCSDPDKKKLQSNLQAVVDEYEALKSQIDQKLGSLATLLQERKQFEDEVDRCQRWLNEAEVATSSEIRASNMALLEEQLAKYDKLGQEAEQMHGSIDNIMQQGRAILPGVSEADKLTLSEELNAIKDKHARITAIIRDRSDSLKDQLKQYKEAAAKVAESVTFMTEIQKELKELNRPVGSKVEDVQGMLGAYEKILADLKANKLKLGDIQLGSMGELQGIAQQQDDLIHAIEAQIARLRQLLLLREQFIALITEIMTFITKYTEVVRDIERGGHTVQEKIRKYDDVIVKIQECEAMLASATDKGQQIAAEGSAADRNSITEQLQSLKQSLQTLRRAVEKQREQHEMTAAEHRKLAAELEEVLDWLHANEATVRSRPLLDRHPASVEAELEKHRELAANVNHYLDRVRAVQESVRHEDGMPSSLMEQLSEANSLLSTLPRELEERGKYLETNRQLRLEYAGLKDRLHTWVRDAEQRLKADSQGVDFQNIIRDLEEHKIFFGSEASMRELVSQHVQQASDRIWPSLTGPEQEELSREQQQLTQMLKNTLNLARSKQAQLEQDVEIWRDYCHALDKVQSVLERSQFTDEPVSTLAGLQFNLQKIEHAINDIQNQQSEIDLLNERAREITRQADPSNRETINMQVKNMNTRWTELTDGLESRKDTLHKLSLNWEEFEKKHQNFESLVNANEEKARHIDTIVRSKPQTVEVKQTLQDLLSEVESHKSLHEEVLFLSGTVLTYLSAFSEPSAQQLKAKLDQLTDTYKRLIETLRGKLAKASDDLKHIETVQDSVAALQKTLKDLHHEVQDFYEFGADQDGTAATLQALRSRVEDTVSKAKTLIIQTKEHYTSTQQSVPSDISQELSSLELLAETVLSTMDDKERQFKRARTVRSDYDQDVVHVQDWLQKAELRLQDRSVEPRELKEHLSQIQSEIGGITDKLDRLTKNGQVICEKTQDDEERNLIKNTVSSLTDQLQQVKSWLDEKKQQVGDTLDSWERFMSLYQSIKSWAEEKQTFLKEPLQLSSLTQTRQKLNDYSTAVKSCKQMAKNLQDMSKELESIGQVTSVGNLPEKLEEAEELKADVESQLVERNALLQETSEEWEQCEKKMKDVRAWIEKSRTSLESPQHKKRPLRDQLNIREKMLSDIPIQKTKISMSVEKLQVHFRAGVGGDNKVSEAAQEILEELDQLLGTVKEQATQLETCLSQLDQYQQEIQQLRQQIVQVEQQLRVVLAPNYSPHDREKAAEEQNACRERVLALQTKISARSERIKLLSQRGTPDSEPLES